MICFFCLLREIETWFANLVKQQEQGSDETWGKVHVGEPKRMFKAFPPMPTITLCYSHHVRCSTSDAKCGNLNSSHDLHFMYNPSLHARALGLMTETTDCLVKPTGSQWCQLFHRQSWYINLHHTFGDEVPVHSVTNRGLSSFTMQISQPKRMEWVTPRWHKYTACYWAHGQ
jgi:hypothetical protein